MKTSNKLLATAIVVLIAAAVVNAFTLKAKFTTMHRTSAVMRDFQAQGFHAVVIMGTAPRGMNVQVTLKRADSTTVRYTDFDFIHVEQDGTTLKIRVDHPTGYEANVRKIPEIVIECPDLIALTAIGTPLDSLDLLPGSHAITQQFYRKSTVNAHGFYGKNLSVTASNGMEVTLSHTQLDSLKAVADHGAKLVIRENVLAHADLEAGKAGSITLEQPQIGTLRTRVALDGELVMKGTDFNLAHGKHH